MKQVIIIDDSLDVARLLRSAILTLERDIQVSVVPSGEEALLEVLRGKPDLVIADVHLPGISGFDLIHKLRKKFNDLRIIVITGSDDSEVERQARELQVEAFLHKPMEIDVFLDAVRKALNLAEEPETPLSGTGQGTTEEPAGADKLVRSSDILSHLCAEMNAGSVVLLDDQAHIVALAGTLPVTDFENTWAPELVTAASSGYRVKRLAAGDHWRQVTFWKGERWIITLAAVGVFTLVVIHPAEMEVQSITVNFNLLLSAQRELEIILTMMGVNIGAAETSLKEEDALASGSSAREMNTESSVDEEDRRQMAEFEALFDTRKRPLKKQDVEAFWKQQDPGKIPGINGTSDDLSYDQAQKLGLTPDNTTE